MDDLSPRSFPISLVDRSIWMESIINCREGPLILDERRRAIISNSYKKKKTDVHILRLLSKGERASFDIR